MKKFLLNLSGFFLLTISSIIILTCSVYIIVRENMTINVAEDIDKIVIGHSHTETAFNDSIINNFSNFSSSGESYFYNYYKTIQILEKNPHIKTVFIGFSNNNIFKGQDERIWGNQVLNYVLPRYAPFLDLDAFKYLMKRNPDSFIQNIGLIERKNISALLGNMNFSTRIGGFLSTKRFNADSLEKVVNTNTIDEKLKYEISESNIEYLEKIVQFCKKRDVKVFLIRTPIHKRSQEFVNEFKFKDVLKRNFKEIEFLDFNQLSLKNCDFGDLEHLNYKGARTFSLFFNSLLDNKLLQKENKQKIIDEAISRFNLNNYCITK